MPSFLRELWRRPAGLIGSVVVVVLLLTAAVALFWTPQNPFTANPSIAWEGPSFAHLFGTDAIGSDIFSYLMAGSKTTVLVAVLSALVAGVIGIGLTAIGSLTSHWVREPVAVLIDILIAFPILLIAMLLSAVFGGSLTVVIVSVGIGFGVNLARVARGEVRGSLGTDYVLAARASGAGPWRILIRHVLPNVAPVFIVQLSLAAAVSILAEAGLSFLGYGAPSSTASWGRLLSSLQRYITVHPWSVLWPGITITITVLGLNLLGDALREATDPRLKQARRRARDQAEHEVAR